MNPDLCEKCRSEYDKRLNRSEALRMRATELNNYSLATEANIEFMAAMVFKEMCHRDHLKKTNWKFVGVIR